MDLKETLECDFSTGELRWKARPAITPEARRWNSRYAGKKALHTQMSKGYLGGKLFGRTVRAHQVVWALAHGRWPESSIDHVNRVITDNSLANLRLATAKVQSMNKGAYNKGSGLPPGVGRFSRSKRKPFTARVQVDGRPIFLGVFATPEEAGARYKLALSEYGFTPSHGSL